MIKGGQSAKFTVSFRSDAPRSHCAYLEGSQRVFSPEAPLELRLWATGQAADGVGALISGTFHPHAGAPPTPLQV